MRGQIVCMGYRQDAIFRSPENQDGHFQLDNLFAQDHSLSIRRAEVRCNRTQSRLYPVEAFVLEGIVHKLPGDQP